MWLVVVDLLALLVTLATLPVVLVQRREPAANLAWALGVILLPFLGPLLFFTLGWRRPERETRMFHHKRRVFGERAGGWAAVRLPGVEFERAEFGAIAEAVDELGGFPARPGNAVEFAADGESFRRMLLSSIRAATRSVHLEFYLYHNDEAGSEVTAALCEKAREGVECRLLLDAVGALWFHSDCLAQLRDAGVHVAFFHPTNPFKKRWQLNYRLHRKIAVFDGRAALTGGRNIGNEYLGGRRGKRTWQDLSLFVRGPAVLDLQSVFLSDWFYTTNEHLEPRGHCPEPADAGSQTVQVVPSQPRYLGGSVEWAYLLAVRSARRSLRIVTPYFVPPESMLTALTTASLAGVDVEIVLPAVSNAKVALWAGRSSYRQLIEAGIRIHEFTDGMLHGKIAIVDDEWCTAGSANMDCRSFRLSFEVNCLLYDRQASHQLTALFERYRARARPVLDPMQYEHKRTDRLLCAVTRLASPLL